jgi:ribosomal protein L31
VGFYRFFDGKVKILDPGGRVARFEMLFGTKVTGTKAGKK